MTPQSRRLLIVTRLSTFLIAALILSGCGQSKRRHRLTGTVTYQGKPVTMGLIRFEAEEGVGDFATTCFAQIVGGKYETKPDESPTTGKYRVLVSGIDESRIKKEPGQPWEMPELFPAYKTLVDVPVPDGTFDVVVPDAKSRKAR